MLRPRPLTMNRCPLPTAHCPLPNATTVLPATHYPLPNASTVNIDDAPTSAPAPRGASASAGRVIDPVISVTAGRSPLCDRS